MAAVAINVTVLGSGSAGNCTFLETAETRLLIDAGFSARQIRQRLATIGHSPDGLTGILVTHEHSDHVQGIAVLCSQLSIPVYCNRATQEALLASAKAPLDCRIFSTGATFEIGDTVIETFSVPHDAQDPVGFLVRTPEARIGFVTDLGHATRLVIERVRTANVLLWEANHDVEMLQNDPRRPWSLKQRILSRHGHLSNVASAEALAQVVTAELQHVYLGHLSRDCNRPELALRVVQERLDQIGASHVRLEATQQAAPNGTLSFGKQPCATPSSLPTPCTAIPFTSEQCGLAL